MPLLTPLTLALLSVFSLGCWSRGTWTLSTRCSREMNRRWASPDIQLVLHGNSLWPRNSWRSVLRPCLGSELGSIDSWGSWRVWTNPRLYASRRVETRLFVMMLVWRSACTTSYALIRDKQKPSITWYMLVLLQLIVHGQKDEKGLKDHRWPIALGVTIYYVSMARSSLHALVS